MATIFLCIFLCFSKSENNLSLTLAHCNNLLLIEAILLLTNAVTNLMGRSSDCPYYDEEENLLIDLNTGVSMDEVWKLRIELARIAAWCFAPEELWTVKNITLQQNNTTAFLNNSITRHGINLRVATLTHSDTTPIDDSKTFRWFKLQTRLSMSHDGWCLSLLATDEKGREVDVSSGGIADVAGDNEREYTFMLRTDLRAA